MINPLPSKSITRESINFLLIYLVTLFSSASLAFILSIIFDLRTVFSTKKENLMGNNIEGEVLQASIGCSHYVDNNCPDCTDSDSGISENIPWCSLSHAAQVATVGNTVCVKAGTYKENMTVKNSGSVDNYITFISYPGDTVNIEGSGIDLGGWGGLFNIKNKSYIKISGFQIKNSIGGSIGDAGPAGILVQDSDHIIIGNNSTFNTKSSGIGVWGSSDVVIDGNEIRRAVNGGSQECITISKTSNFEVKNNKVHDGVGLDRGGEGIDIKGYSAYGEVYNNRVYDLPNEVGIYIDAYSSKSPYLHDVEIYNNVVSAPVGIALGAEQGGHIEDIKVFNNVVYGGSAHGIVVTAWVGENQGTKKNVDIVNNTVYHCGHGGSWGGGIRVETDKVENIIINNNIVSQNNRWQISVTPNARSQVFVSNNLIDGFLNGYQEIYGENYLEGDPKFVNSTEGDFHLMSDSSAIDAGISTKAPLCDHENNLRPQGKTFDIGAYEYVSILSSYDLNDDGEVNTLDLRVLLENWSQEYLPADFNEDGIINLVDFAILIQNLD
jgi:hypothetical protein